MTTLRWLRLRGILTVLALGFGATTVAAQEFEPRTYTATPVGLNFFALGYGFSSGNVLMDPALPIEGVDADVHRLFARYTRSLSLFDRTAKLKVVLPWSTGDWTGFLAGAPGERHATGMGDVRVALETVLTGARAMNGEEIRSFQPRTLVGARVQLVAPTGKYNNTKLINLGSNRFTFVPELGISHTVGKWTFEGAVGAWIFTDNDDFFEGNRLEQNPLFVAKFHAIRTVRAGFWWAVAVGYGYGGRTVVNGTPRETLQRNFRLTAMLVFPVSSGAGLSVAVVSGRNAGAGSDFDGLALAYQVAF